MLWLLTHSHSDSDTFESPYNIVEQDRVGCLNNTTRQTNDSYNLGNPIFLLI